jgi:hypothetical protein
VIAGPLLRIFIRLNAIERVQASLGRRLAALEKNGAAVDQIGEIEAHRLTSDPTSLCAHET